MNAEQSLTPYRTPTSAALERADAAVRVQRAIELAFTVAALPALLALQVLS